MKDHKKTILFVIYSHNVWGGIESWLAKLVDSFRDTNWRVVVAIAQGKEFNKPHLVADRFPNADVYVMDGRVGTEYARVSAVRTAIQKCRADIVVPLGIADCFAAVRAERITGGTVKLVSPVHATNPELLHDISSNEDIVDACVVVNPLQASFLSEHLGFDTSKLFSILNGVTSPSLPHPHRSESNQLRAVFVGRLDEGHKRVLDLVSVINEANRRKLNISLTVVGSGPAEQQLRANATGGNESCHVDFLGYKDPDFIQNHVYPNHQVILLFSPSEGCPLVIQEAMSHGLVPVCSTFLGVHSLGFLRHQATAMLFNIGDTKAAVDHLAYLLSNHAEFLRISSSALSAASEFTYSNCHKRWHGVFERIVNEPRSVSRIAPVVHKPQGLLDQILSPVTANFLRNVLRRWPKFSDGWAEWPGTVSLLSVQARLTYLEALRMIDLRAEDSEQTNNRV